ncbi:MAG TPA: hypothetical protein VFQ55_05180, partial [Casimicrobiaceae bacterium]|nr:hypothetical protein [Casimicrobiaceae bacterium]
MILAIGPPVALARVCLIGRNDKEVAMKSNTLSPWALPAIAASLALSACGGGREPPPAATAANPAAGASAEMSWARAALERNPALEVLAADPATGVFTVRDRASGEVRTVNVAELAAAPVAMLATPSA